MIECERRHQWFGSCKFEARYDTHLPNSMTRFRGSEASLEASKDKTYVRDVCIRCGKTIEREKAD